MKRILKWLESKFSQRSAAVEADEHHTLVGVRPKESVKEENIDNDHTATFPTLTSLEESSFVVIESTGFDPYNSGSFETSKSRSHK